MDYTYKSSISDKACTILLTDYHLTVQSAGKEEIVPYANITSVRLTRNKKRTFKIYLYPDDQKPLEVTNFYYLSSREVEDRSRQYGVFVRVLHLHLKDKSAAVFSAGLSLNRLIAWGVIATALALLIFLSIYYFRPDIQNLPTLGVILAATIVVGMVVLSKNAVPKYYRPTDIPLEFLP
jgi:hypothetical protein